MKTFKIHPALDVPRKYRPEGLTLRLWWKVWLFGTKREMWSTAGGDEGFSAMVRPMPILRFDPKKEPLARLLGHAYFSCERIGGGIVAHEATHMAVGTLDALAHAYNVPRFAIGDEGEREEWLCYVVGSITRQFWNEVCP